MELSEREMIRRWVETWKRAGPELEAIRRKEVREANNVEVMACLEDAFNHGITVPPDKSSGLVEMERVLQKLCK